MNMAAHLPAAGLLLHLQLILVSVLLLESCRIASSYYSCGNTTFFAPNSTNQSNLNNLLSTLSSNAANKTGFYSSSSSSKNSTVYGLLLCGGDTEPEACRNCVPDAVQLLLKDCPKDKEAVIWDDNCMVRYSNQPVYSKLDMSPALLYVNTQKVSNATHLAELVHQTMFDISRTAAARSGSEKKYATKAVRFSGSQTVYNKVQCTPDLSAGDCGMCLERARSSLRTDQYGCRVLMPSCNARFEFYKFYTGGMPRYKTRLRSHRPHHLQEARIHPPR